MIVLLGPVGERIPFNYLRMYGKQLEFCLFSHAHVIL